MANPTACLLIIGNEVLSGRTKDANLQFLATRLGELGIPLREARVIDDYRSQAFAMLTSPNSLRAFDLASEPARVKERYGLSPRDYRHRALSEAVAC